MTKQRKWYVDNEEVSYIEYRKALKEAYKHTFRVYMKAYRLAELTPNLQEFALDSYILDRNYYIIDGSVYFGDVNVATVEEWIAGHQQIEDANGTPTYYDYRGRIIGEEEEETE